MNIMKRIKLRELDYFICCDCIYKNKDNNKHLCLKNYKDDYFDSGDLSVLINKIENNYNSVNLKKYDNDICFLSDCLYIYDNIPFITGVGDFYLSTIDNTPHSASYITKEELDRYIEDNNIKMKDNTNFKLYDERTWNIKY